MASGHSTNGCATLAAAYLRCSTDDQAEASIPAQREAIERYAADHGFKLVAWYADEGVSGDQTRKRLQFQQMIADAQAGAFKAVIVWDISRLGRFDSLEAGYWLTPLRDAGVDIATIDRGVIDWHDFAGRVVYAVEAEAKHQFLRDLSRTTTRGMIRTARDGFLCGQAAPYGFDRMLVDEAGNHRQRVKNRETVGKPKNWRVTLVPSDDPVKVATVRWLFSTYANTDTGLRRLAEELNHRGTAGPTGRQWYAGTVREILRNPAYVGRFVWARRREGKYHRVAAGEIRQRDRTEVVGGSPRVIDNPQATWIVKEGAFEAIIDLDTFDRVQAKLDTRKRSDNPGYRSHVKTNGDAYLLSGLVYCAHCGAKMHGNTSKRNKAGKTYAYHRYMCSTYYRTGKQNPHGCGCHTANQDELVAVLVGKLRGAMLSGNNRQRLEDEIRRQLESRSKPDHQEADKLKRRLAELDKQIVTAADRLLTAPDDLMDLLAPRLQAMKRERQTVADQLAKATREAAPKNLEAEAKRLADRLWTLADELRNAPPERQREVFRLLVQRIDLRFRQTTRGKRMTCELEAGEIQLRSEDASVFGSVSRGGGI